MAALKLALRLLGGHLFGVSLPRFHRREPQVFQIQYVWLAPVFELTEFSLPPLACDLPRCRHLRHYIVGLPEVVPDILLVARQRSFLIQV
jgi:hypothetical protein